MQIVDFFYELAKEHKLINGFRYGSRGGKGNGKDPYPLMWLDDPILWGGTNEATGEYTVNLDILGIPDETQTVQDLQDMAENIGLSIIQRMLQIRAISGYRVARYSFITLREYYDDDAAGCRFTYNIAAANPVDRCVNDFDPTKVFPTVNDLPKFNVENPDGCAVFYNGNGLPKFNIDE